MGDAMDFRRTSGSAVFVVVAGLLGLGNTGCGSSPSNSGAPSNLAYATNPAVYTVGTAIAPNSPSSSGGAVTQYTAVNTLPAGLALDATTGVISGTPTAVAATAKYTIQASNSAGSATADVTITVKAGAVTAPTNLTYATNPATYAKGVAITANRPSNGGGAITSYSVVGTALPAGLSLDAASGVISGTPTVVAATASYTIKGTNAGGSTQATVSITVNDGAPTGLTYSANPATYVKGTAITANNPTNGGGAITSYSVVGTALPPGLSLNATTGVISGTPTAVAAMASYTIQGSNSGGNTQATVSITVNDAAPTSLTYSSNPATYTKGTLITPNTPSNGGGAITAYTVVGTALPAGLSLNGTTGVITGTPTALTATASYTIQGSNVTGNTQVSVSITVNDQPPSNLTYSSNPATYVKGTAITPNTPSNSGGGIGTYTVVGTALPAGLSLSPTTGVISGTPTAVAATANYTIQGSNAVGSTQATVSITVNDAAPTSLTYSSNPATYVKGTAIAANNPSNGGGAITSYSVVGTALPAGLLLNAVTGVISGTPTAVAGTASYTIKGSNVTGSAQASVTITVNDAAPTALTYSSNPATYVKGTAITANNPSNTGGAITSYTVVGTALPAGLALNASTGVISGTPTAVTATASYTIQGSNVTGNTQASVSITVNDAAPTALTYSSNPATYVKGTAIAANNPSNTGGAITAYTVVGAALPAGLLLNAVTGVITGTPTVITPKSNFTIQGSNVTGSTQATVSITVNDAPPANLKYSSNPAVYTVGSLIPVNTPSSTGGAVTSLHRSDDAAAGTVAEWHDGCHQRDSHCGRSHGELYDSGKQLRREHHGLRHHHSRRGPADALRLRRQ